MEVLEAIDKWEGIYHRDLIDEAGVSSAWLSYGKLYLHNFCLINGRYWKNGITERGKIALAIWRGKMARKRGRLIGR
jgi:hypothetical protein